MNEMVGVETREPHSVRCKTWYNFNLRPQRSSSHTDCVVAHIRCRLLRLLSIYFLLATRVRLGSNGEFLTLKSGCSLRSNGFEAISIRTISHLTFNPA